MDISKTNFKKPGRFASSKRKLAIWLDGKMKLGKYVFPRKNIFLMMSVIFVVLAISLGIVFSGRSHQADAGVAIEKEIQALTNQIGKFMELPQDEQPTLATVTDRAKLKRQEFFAHAQDGDKLLIYAKAKKAILYRPSSVKLIEIANLTSENRLKVSAEESAPDSSNF